MNSKKLLCATILFLLVLGIAGVLWAAPYNRPNPTMDYVPQEIGIYDTMYYEHAEHNCRKCHGNSTADRHHGVPQVVRDHLCTTCHPTCTVGEPDCENGITIHRNCLTSGCHSWNDVQFGNEKWHHNTDMAGSENCIACHNPNLIEEITPYRDPELYPPTVVTPSPFSCENCHWEQKPATHTGNPNNPGHPSTYYHEDDWGNPITCPPNGTNCLWEYGKGIWNNIDTHHMDFVGSVGTSCYKCHSTDPDWPNWNPNDPRLIRYCELCHSLRTLHTIGPHVSDHDGWRPVGFHTSNPGIDDPTTYAKWGSIRYAPQVNPGYSADMQCFGCHGDSVPPWEADPTCDPNIAEITPIAGSCGALVTIRGACFGEEHIEGRDVQLQLRGQTPPAPWVTVPIHAWTDTLIEFEIPCWAFAPGNYNVRVHTENGNSNKKVFTIKGHPSLFSISPERGPCSTVITLNGDDFGNKQSQWLDDRPHYYGVTHVVDFVASNGTFTATKYPSWSNTQIKVKVWDWFEDSIDTCSIDPITGQPRNARNFVRDIGDENGSGTITCDNASPVFDECAAEPLIPRCDCFALGNFSVYVKAIYFGDDDGTGSDGIDNDGDGLIDEADEGLTCGDTIYQVEVSDYKIFELTNAPYINKLNPKSIVDDNTPPLSLLKVYGGNFGTVKGTGDSVRVGTKRQADSATLGLGTEWANIKLWSDALIKVRAKPVPDAWRGKTKYVWVEKAGQKSNSKPLKILAP